MNERSNPFTRRVVLQQLAGLSIGLAMLPVIGCTKMIVGSGKLLFGDPKLPSEFTTLTKEDLTIGQKTVLVICSTPEGVEDEVSTLKFDIIDGVTRRMKLQGIKIISPNKVTDWIDEHEGIAGDPQQLARDFDTDYIIWIDVQAYDLHEPNSPKLLRGQTSGYIRVFRVDEQNQQRMALKVYQTEFALVYPQHQPLSQQGRGLESFQKDYMKQLCNLLAERFYDHRPGATF